MVGGVRVGTVGGVRGGMVEGVRGGMGGGRRSMGIISIMRVGRGGGGIRVEMSWGGMGDRFMGMG